MQHRDGQVETYKALATRPGPEGALTLHIHGSGEDKYTHEHTLGEGAHRHGPRHETLIIVQGTGRPSL